MMLDQGQNRVSSPRKRRTRRLSSCLFGILGSGLAFMTLFSLCGTSWLLPQLDTHGPFFSTLTETSQKEEDPTKYSAKRIRKMEKKVAQQLDDGGSSKVRSCRRFQNDGDQIVLGPKCKEKFKAIDRKQRSVVVFNPAAYERYWCGIKIESRRTRILTERQVKQLCKEPPRMSDITPTIEGTDMPPIQLTTEGGEFFDGESVTAMMEPFPCDVPCEHAGFPDVIRYFKPKGMDVTITYSMESSQHYPELQIDEYAYRQNQFYATTSFRSEIPLPYFSFSEYNISNPAVDYDDAIEGASFIARNCESMSNREEIVQELMKSTRVDSISECLHNAEPPQVEDDGGLNGKIAIMRSYLFHLAFENSKEDDYITEKLWGTLQSGTLPIYYGAPNVKEHAPPNSIISWHDFDSTEELAQYMNKVANDKELYDSYHEWRNKPLPQSFLSKFEITNTHSVCRMCRWAYAKKYGFGWGHKHQTIQDLTISRELKYATTGEVTAPFRDSWVGADKGAGWERTAWEHDGVIDVHFDALQGSNSTVYRMTMPLRGEFQVDETFPHIFTLQNENSRVTIVTSWEATVTSPKPNMIDITLVDSFDMLRVRVIIEDVDKFHKDANKVPSYFGDFMARKDFFTPMEVLIVEKKHQEMDTAAQ